MWCHLNFLFIYKKKFGGFFYMPCLVAFILQVLLKLESEMVDFQNSVFILLQFVLIIHPYHIHKSEKVTVTHKIHITKRSIMFNYLMSVGLFFIVLLTSYNFTLWYIYYKDKTILLFSNFAWTGLINHHLQKDDSLQVYMHG